MWSSALAARAPLQESYSVCINSLVTPAVPQEGRAEIDGDRGEPDHEEAKGHALGAVLDQEGDILIVLLGDGGVAGGAGSAHLAGVGGLSSLHNKKCFTSVVDVLLIIFKRGPKSTL